VEGVIRVYLADGQFKSLMIEHTTEAQNVMSLVAEKFRATSHDDFREYQLYESLGNGKSKYWRIWILNIYFHQQLIKFHQTQNY
jgi:hypothetical protein